MSRTRRTRSRTKPEIDEQIDEAVDEKVTSILDELHSVSGLDDDEDDTEVDELEEVREQIIDKDSFDIFDHVINPRIQEGDQLKWELIQNGSVLGTFFEVSSWANIQEDYGGGTFKVVVKSMNTGGYIKSETKRLAVPKVKKEQEKQAAQSADFTKILDSMMAMTQENNRRFEQMMREREREKKEENKENNGVLATVLQALITKPEPRQDMSLEMMKMMIELNNKAQERTESLIERMANQMRDTIAALRPDDKEDPLDIMEKINEAAEKAEQRVHKFYEQVEAKVSAAKSSDDGKSTTDKLIESFMPALPGLINLAATRPANGGQQRMLPTPKPNKPAQAAPQPAPKQPKKGEFAPRPNAPKVEPKQNAAPAPQKAPFKPAVIQGGLPGVHIRKDEPVTEKKPNSMVSDVDAEEFDGEEDIEDIDFIDATPDNVQEVSPDVTISEAELKVIEHHVQQCLPMIAQALMSKQDAGDTARECAAILIASNTEPAKMRKELSIEFFNQIAEDSGLMGMARAQGDEETLTTWLEALHAEIHQEYARLFAGKETGELAPSTI